MGRFKIKAGSKVGVDLWSPRVEESLKGAFPGVTFVDGYDVLLNAKMIKTEDEAELHSRRGSHDRSRLRGRP